MEQITSHQLSTSLGVLALLAAAGFAQPVAAEHLLLSEITVAPDQAEFIEIVNPTERPIALGNYYLADDQDYALLPALYRGSTQPPEIGQADFIVRFPAGAVIGPQEVIVIAMRGLGFLSTYGFRADFEIKGEDAQTPDMIATLSGASPTLFDAGECIALFTWDGASDLVQDVDLVRWGAPSSVNDLPNKTGLAVDGPDADATPSMYLRDAFTMPVPASFPAPTQSLKRIAPEGSHESAGGGNGLNGHDETSENILATWDFGSYTAPNPSVANLDEPPIADLAAEVVGRNFASAGSTIALTLTVSNIGTLPAADISITAELPADVQFESQSSEPPGWAFLQDGSTLEWSAPSLTYGGSCAMNLEISLDAQMTGQVQFNVTAATTSNEASVENNVVVFIIDIENGSPCLGDFVSNTTFAPPPDGAVDGADLAFLLGAWGPALGSSADIVSSATFAPPPDGVVDGADLAVLLGAWGVCE